MRPYLTIIIPAADKDDENAWMQSAIDRSGGSLSFSAPLTSDGVNITHYWLRAPYADDTAQALQDRYGANAYVGGSPGDILQSAGLQRYSEQL